MNDKCDIVWECITFKGNLNVLANHWVIIKYIIVDIDYVPPLELSSLEVVQAVSINILTGKLGKNLTFYLLLRDTLHFVNYYC